MKKIRLFDEPKPIKGERVLRTLLALFMFVITPAVSVFVITRGEQSALYNSMSRLAWSENLLGPIYVCGILNVGTFILAEYLALKKIGFSRFGQILFLTLIGIVTVTITVGLGIPCYFTDDPHDIALRNAHIQTSMAGFIGIYVVLLLFTVAVWFRNKKLAFWGTLVDLFTIICGLFALLEVNDPTSFVVTSAPAQIFLFTLYNISMALHYYGAFMYPNPPEKNG